MNIFIFESENKESYTLIYGRVCSKIKYCEVKCFRPQIIEVSDWKIQPVRGNFKRHLVSIFLIAFTAGSFYAANFIFAAPPTNPYTPGETLNPTCSPGDVNCTVSAHMSDYFVASSTSATSTFAWGIQTTALNVTSSTASSTFANGINLSAGCFAIGGTCLSASVGSGITSLGAQYSAAQNGASQTFATSSDTNIGLTITSSGDTHTFTPTWTGSLAVTRGGTGATSFGQGWIYSAGGTGALAASTSPTINYLVATSTTATSTFAYDVSIEGRLHILQNGTSAVVIGNTTGNARGSNALDIQSSRSDVDEIASGQHATAIGNLNTASSFRTTAIGYNNIAANGSDATAIGSGNNAGNTRSLAVGYQNTINTSFGISIGNSNTIGGSGIGSVVVGQSNSLTRENNLVFGRSNSITADNAGVFGSYITNSTASSTMIGPGDASKLTILGTTGSIGYVGIGTTSPYAKLSVVGQTVAEYFTATSTTATSTFNGFIDVLGTGVNATSTFSSNLWVKGSLKIGLNSIILTDNGIVTTHGSSTFNALNFASSTAEGAGTLTVNGNNFLHNYGENNLFLGLRAGNTSLSTLNSVNNIGIGSLTLSSLTNGSSNIGIGNQSLAALLTGTDNVAIGKFALQQIDSGSENVAMGNATGFGLDTNSQHNTIIGYGALWGNNGIVNNTVSIGHSSGFGITTGDNNIFLGYRAGDALTTGANNIIIGYDIDAPAVSSSNTLNIGNLLYGTGLDGTNTTLSTGNIGIGTSSPYAKLSVVGEVVAQNFTATSSTATSTFAGAINIANTAANGAGVILKNGSPFIQAYGTRNFFAAGAGNFTLTTGSAVDNIGLGSTALDSVTGGASNTAIGTDALTNITNGSGNIGIGFSAANGIAIGLNNVSIGNRSLEATTDGSNNVAIGGIAARQLSSSSENNVAIGYQALYGNSGIVVNSIGIGYSAGMGLTTGDNNIFLGYQAGDNLTTGANNIIIGYNIDATSTSMTRGLNIGNLLFGTGLDGTGTTLSTGNIGIGTTSPQRRLHVAITTDGAPVRFEDSSGYCEIDPTSTTWTCTSDERLKKEINPIGSSLLKLNALDPVNFQWKKQQGTSTQIGLIAQEVEKVFPDLVKTDENGFKSVAYGNLTTLSLQGIQDLSSVLGIQAIATTSTSTAEAFRSVRLDDIEARLTAIENRSRIISDTSGVGDTVVAALTSFKDLIADTVTATLGIFKKVKIEDGMEIKDKATGEWYCITIQNGEWNKVKGECASTQLANPISNPVTEVPTTSTETNDTSTTTSSSSGSISDVIITDAPIPPVEQTTTTPPPEQITNQTSSNTETTSNTTTELVPTL